MQEYLQQTNLDELLAKFPYAEDFFRAIGITAFKVAKPIGAFLNDLPEEVIEDCGLDRNQILDHFTAFIEKMDELKTKANFTVREITVIGGHDKTGNKENISFTMMPGEVISIVGTTGSGKSRLLADIESLAQMDTPTGRQILLNGATPPPDLRFSIEHKLVAQLSQNMNFIMDLTVEEFITTHAESRMIENSGPVIQAIVDCANELTGETFAMTTPVTALSGGQSRALMIADTALLSSSPIVLIDEIENAGVDRKKALELLVREEKIVLMATHDPILALMGTKRLVIRNGAVAKVISTNQIERDNLKYLQEFDTKLVTLRNLLRSGEEIDFNVRDFLTTTLDNHANKL